MAARAAEIQRTMRIALPRVGQGRLMWLTDDTKRSSVPPWASRNCTGGPFTAETQWRRDKRGEDKAGWKEGAGFTPSCVAGGGSRVGIAEGEGAGAVAQQISAKGVPGAE